MSRSSAVKHQHAVADPDVVVREGPANDAHASHGSVPQYVVTARVAAEFRREAEALRADAVKPVPSDVDARLSWMEVIQGAAWRDQGELARVNTDGAPITRAEIDAFGARIEWVRNVVAAGRVVAPVTAESAASMPSAILEARLREGQQTLHRALMYRFRDDPARREPLSGSQRVRSQKGLSARTATLLQLCATPGMEAWLRGLPRGEGAALDALRVLHPEWVQRLKNKVGPKPGAASADLAARAFATLTVTRDRLLAAGRYLTQGRAGREGAYAGYKRPAKRKAARPAATAPASSKPSTSSATPVLERPIL